MTRSILVVLAVGTLVSIFGGSGCTQGGVGDPCIPEQEYDTCFAGFDEAEVNVESKSFQCQTRLCLVNHFQGRVSCPYGQTAGTAKLASCPQGVVGGPPIAPYYPGTNTLTCSIPGGASVLGSSQTLAAEYAIQVAVPPQVTPRQTANAVYCSCHCANPNGRTDDGQVYCQCPDGYGCEQLVTSIGSGMEGLTGGYCIKTGTKYDPTMLGAQQNCAPSSNPCP